MLLLFLHVLLINVDIIIVYVYDIVLWPTSEIGATVAEW